MLNIQPFRANSIKELEKIVIQGKFDEIEEVSKEANDLINEVLQVDPKKRINIDKILKLKSNIYDNLELANILSNDMDEELFNSLQSSVENIKKQLDETKLLLLLNGPYDKCDCILEIHPGAGGTESCDWANMLYRMYF